MIKTKENIVKIKKLKFIFISLLSITIIGAVLNLNTSITVGKDWQCRQIKMPLYIKWTEFLARHYEYGRMAKEITAGYDDNGKEVLALLRWTHQNIKDVPPGMPVMDDHILYIIVRGYGVPEQFQDVFTTLCTYAGIPAFWRKIRDREHKTTYPISFVLLNGKWRVFDAYRARYFIADNGEIASVEDILKKPSLVKGDDIDHIYIDGVPYKEFFNNMGPVSRPQTLRAEKQMPLHRIVYETKRAFKLEKDDGSSL